MTRGLSCAGAGDKIVDIERSFLDTAGASRSAAALIAQAVRPLDWETGTAAPSDPLETRWLAALSDLAVASQRGLGERFDGSIGSASVLFPMGGARQSTPECGMAARIPVGPNKETTTTSLMTMGYDPKAANWSPYHGAQYAVLESLAKILALGGDPRSARLTFQEYFERTSSPTAWGKPAAALLGALRAQLEMGTAAIGGKDSMSGTFHDICVPPTLVSFAVAVTDDSLVRGGALTTPDNTLMLVQTPWLNDNTPDWGAFRANIEAVLELGKTGKIARPIRHGGRHRGGRIEDGVRQPDRRSDRFGRPAVYPAGTDFRVHRFQ
jgi:phosphoribosylformylglycinamidine synthase